MRQKQLFKCNFPGCKYETNHRSKIDYHHINPKEIDSSPSNKITIPLCKTHHSLIFHPGVKYGMHSINTENSLKILGLFKSTDGNAILYENYEGKQFFYLPLINEYMNV